MVKEKLLNFGSHPDPGSLWRFPTIWLIQGGSKKSKLLTQHNSLLFLSHPVSPERVIGFSWKFYHRWIRGQRNFR